MAIPIQVTFDCANPAALASFWAEALEYVLQPPPGRFASWDEFLTSIGVPQDEWESFSSVVDPQGVGPRLFFQQVPEGKAVKNRVHLDVNAGGGLVTPADERRVRVDDKVDALAGAGATELRRDEENGEYSVVMQDPEGNEFCVQ